MPLYFEIGPSPRRVVELGRRDAIPRTGIDYSPVAEELVSEELSVHELTGRLRAAENAVKRMRKGLTRADGEYGGPATDRERAKWERHIREQQARIPRIQVLLTDAERRATMMRAVMAGKQFDDRLAPLPAAPAPAAPEGDALPAAEPESAIAVEWGAAPEVDPRVAEVAAHLDRLSVPTDIGRTKVREVLVDRDPDYRVGDAPLSAAIAYRRSSSH